MAASLIDIDACQQDRGQAAVIACDIHRYGIRFCDAASHNACRVIKTQSRKTFFRLNFAQPSSENAAWLLQLDNPHQTAGVHLSKKEAARRFGREMMRFPQALVRAATVAIVATMALQPISAQTFDPNLIEAARKEGEVVWYTTLIVTQIVRPLVQAFEKKYPGIKVSYTAAPFQEVATRIVNEGRTANVKADLFDGGATLYPIHAAGFTAPYRPSAAAAYPAEFKDPDGYWTANIVQVVSPAINTDLVPASDAPRTLDDLLDPKWRGRMAWTDAPSAGGPPGFIGAVLLSLGKEKGMEFLTKLAEQRIANIPSNQRVVLDQTIGGQYPLVLCIFNYHAALSAGQGAPVQWLRLLPILTFGTVAMVKNGPHPNATRLLIEFMLSEEGQKIHADAGYIPAHPNVPTKSPELKPEAGKYQYKLVTPETYQANAAEWTSIYKKLFQ